jgi:hypothetical protein
MNFDPNQPPEKLPSGLFVPGSAAGAQVGASGVAVPAQTLLVPGQSSAAVATPALPEGATQDASGLLLPGGPTASAAQGGILVAARTGTRRF